VVGSNDVRNNTPRTNFINSWHMITVTTLSSSKARAAACCAHDVQPRLSCTALLYHVVCQKDCASVLCRARETLALPS